MEDLAASLIEFQIALVNALGSILTLGVTLIGLGLVTAAAAPVLGYRIKRLGIQIIAASLVLLIAHGALIGAFGAEVPVGVLVAGYGLIALLLLQALLNIVFGPDVGNRVVATLLTNLLMSLVRLFLLPFQLLRNLLR